MKKYKWTNQNTNPLNLDNKGTNVNYFLPQIFDDQLIIFHPFSIWEKDSWSNISWKKMCEKRSISYHNSITPNSFYNFLGNEVIPNNIKLPHSDTIPISIAEILVKHLIKESDEGITIQTNEMEFIRIDKKQDNNIQPNWIKILPSEHSEWLIVTGSDSMKTFVGGSKLFIKSIKNIIELETISCNYNTRTDWRDADQINKKLL